MYYEVQGHALQNDMLPFLNIVNTIKFYKLQSKFKDLNLRGK